MTEADLEAAIASDDEGEFDWSRTRIGFPRPKQQLTVRLDRNLVDCFKAQGRGDLSRTNAVLRGYVDAHKG